LNLAGLGLVSHIKLPVIKHHWMKESKGRKRDGEGEGEGRGMGCVEIVSPKGLKPSYRTFMLVTQALAC
jgi:hypothetical protein